MAAIRTDRVPAGVGWFRLGDGRWHPGRDARPARVRTDALTWMIAVAYAVFGVADHGFAQSLNSFEAYEPEPGLDTGAQESQDHVEANAAGGWVIEKNAEDAYPEMRGMSRATKSPDHYIKPYPISGCLDYDENDSAHGSSGCREL